MSKARVVFAGTPEFAVPSLRAICGQKIDVVGVYTQPDRPAGRGRKIAMSAVKQAALEQQLPIFQPESLRSEEQYQILESLKADIMVVAAYGQILSQRALAIPRLGCVNLHASILPRWRGAAPIHRAIQAGDAATGVTLMQMAKGCDTGDILDSMAIPIDPEDSTGSLHDKLALVAAELIASRLEDLLAQRLTATPQDPSLVTHAAKISRAEAKIDWQQSAQVIERCTRAFSPWPGSWTRLDGLEMKVWKATVKTGQSAATPGTIMAIGDEGLVVACGEDALCITEVQRAGSRRMSVSDYLSGTEITLQSVFE